MYGSRKPFGRSELGALYASNACFAREEPSSKRVGGVDLVESRQSYVRGVELSREPPKLQQA